MSNLSMKLDKIAALLQEMIARMDAQQEAVDKAAPRKDPVAEMIKREGGIVETELGPMTKAELDAMTPLIRPKRGPGRPRKNV